MCSIGKFIYVMWNATETWCLKAKTIAKLNFTEMDF
jgi:hypothetical protein